MDYLRYRCHSPWKTARCRSSARRFARRSSARSDPPSRRGVSRSGLARPPVERHWPRWSTTFLLLSSFLPFFARCDRSCRAPRARARMSLSFPPPCLLAPNLFLFRYFTNSPILAEAHGALLSRRVFAQLSYRLRRSVVQEQSAQRRIVHWPVRCHCHIADARGSPRVIGRRIDLPARIVAAAARR